MPTRAVRLFAVTSVELAAVVLLVPIFGVFWASLTLWEAQSVRLLDPNRVVVLFVLVVAEAAPLLAET